MKTIYLGSPPNECDLMNNDYDITYAANIFFQIICKHPIVYF